MRNEAGRKFGIIGPTPDEIEYFRSLQCRSAERVLARNNLIPVSSPSLLGSFFEGIFAKLPFIIPVAIAIGAVTYVAQDQIDEPSSSDPVSTPSADETLPIEMQRVLPFTGVNFLNQGEHTAYKGSEGDLNSIDIAGKQVIKCEGEERKTAGEQDVVAVTSGTIAVLGDPDDRTDRNHSIVGIKEKETGIVFLEVHLEPNGDIELGEEVVAGQPIGKASCEVPAKGGESWGIHVHLTSQGIPIRGLVFSEWEVDGDDMVHKDGTVRAEDTRRCDNDQKCEGKRNDLTLLDQPEPVESPEVEQVMPSDWDLWRTSEFEIAYPKDWQAITLDSTEFGVDPKIAIIGKELFPGETLEEYAQRLKEDKEAYTDVRLTNGPKIKNQPSIVLEYFLASYIEGVGYRGEDNDRKEYLVQLRDKVWIFRLQSKPGEGARYQSLMDYMMNSFTLK